jgi:hypothetical protein
VQLERFNGYVGQRSSLPAIHNEELVTGAKDDRTFGNLSDMRLVEMRGRVTFGSRFRYIEALQVDDYGLIIGEFTESRLFVRGPIMVHALHHVRLLPRIKLVRDRQMGGARNGESR